MGVTLVSRPGSWLLDVPLSKYELMVSIDDTFASLRREVSRVQAPASDAPTPGGGWSVTDHLAHLERWEALELARVEGRPGMLETLTLQAEALRRKLRRGPDRRAGWSHLEEMHRRLVRALWDLPEAALRRPWHPARSFTLAAELATNTVEHYRQHLAEIRELPADP